MRVAILSGKGGTGKTTVSASLAATIPSSQYMDCDVEEPNGAIFLKPQITEVTPVKVSVPEVDMALCDFCGKCAKACQFNAIAVVKDDVLLFPEICHHCGACIIACPKEAISEVDRTIGAVETNVDSSFVQGRLNIGEPINIPIIEELKRRTRAKAFTILDCPPGASCTVVSAIEDCDYGVLVTEPTPFGLHDLKIAVKLVKKMGIPLGIVINKAIANNRSTHDFCESEDIEVLMEIPFSRKIAEEYSKGLLPVKNDSLWRERFKELWGKIERGAGK